MKTVTGDTSLLLASAALAEAAVFGMIFFFGGMVRRKNVLNTIMQGFAAVCVAGVAWMLWGYTIAFGPDHGGLIGGLDWLWLEGVGQESAPFAPSVPHLAHMLFEGMFATLAVTVTAGAFVERMRFPAFLLFSALWITFVYAPIAHWVWGGGWLGGTLGGLDFAGSAAVHASAGVSAIIAILVIGNRSGFGVEPFPPHSRVLALSGAGLLVFGWLGLHAGKAFSAGAVATAAFTNTIAAGAAATLSWLAIEWISRGKPTAIGAVTGMMAGLVSIAGGAGFVSPIPAAAIGGIGGLASFAAVSVRTRLHFDDALDIFGIHAVGGIWGTLAAGLFSSEAVNPLGADGALLGNPPLLGLQVIMVMAVCLFAALQTFLLLKIIDWIVGLRVDEEREIYGLDITQHGERGYSM